MMGAVECPECGASGGDGLQSVGWPDETTNEVECKNDDCGEEFEVDHSGEEPEVVESKYRPESDSSSDEDA